MERAKAGKIANVVVMVKIKFPHKPEEVACKRAKLPLHVQVELGLVCSPAAALLCAMPAVSKPSSYLSITSP